jgi:hypothetical protein
MEKKINHVITLAATAIRHAGAMESSAKLCLSDAISLARDGDLSSALKRALDSIRYSVGEWSELYKEAEAIKNETKSETTKSE